MNEFDQFVKHILKVKYYARYTDDFVIISEDESYLNDILPLLSSFLEEKLKLKLHPKKVEIRRYNRGVDFLGYVVLSHHVVLRAKTKRRMFKKLKLQVLRYKAGYIKEAVLLGSLRSYLGILSHANAYKLKKELLSQFWYWLKE